MNKPNTPGEVQRAIAEINPICHPKYDIARKEIREFATSLGPKGRMALCISPSGTGKTELYDWTMRTAFGRPESWPFGTKPLIGKTLRTTTNGFFSSKWMCRSFLDAIHDPFRALPTTISSWDLEEPVKGRLQCAVAGLSRVRDVEEEYQDAFIGLAKAFKVQNMLLDEANLMALTQRDRSSTDYLEIVRGLLNAAEMNALLFGTGDLVEALDYSAQMNRRERIITPGRFVQADAIWRDFVAAIEADLGIGSAVLTKRFRALHSLTYGIPGELVEIILRAAEHAGAVGAKEVQWDHIEAKLMPQVVVERIREEADWIEASVEMYRCGETKRPERPHAARNGARTRSAGKPQRMARRYPVAARK